MSTPGSPGTPCILLPAGALTNTLGVQVICAFLTAMLYGVTTVQTFIYYAKYYNESLGMRSLIALLWMIDTAHIAFIIYSIYFYTVINFGNALALDDPTVTVVTVIMLTNIGDALVRSVFARRVWILQKRKWHAPAVILSLTIVGLAFGITAGGKVASPSFTSLAQFDTIAWIFETALSILVVADVCIAVCLCFSLAQSRTGFRSTDNLVTKLMAGTINTGLLMTLGSLSVIIAYVTSPSSAIYIGLYFLRSKLSLNSLLATLNARDALRGKSIHTTNSSDIYPLSSVITVPSMTRSTRTAGGSQVTSRTAAEDYAHRVGFTSDPEKRYGLTTPDTPTLIISAEYKEQDM